MEAPNAATKNVVMLTEGDAFTGWLLTDAAKLHVVFFFAAFDAASRPGGQMDAVVDALAGLHSNVLFAKVNAEEAVEVSEQFDVGVVPTFVLVRNKGVVDKLEGADASELRKRVEVLANKTVIALTTQPVKSVDELHQRLEKLINAQHVMLFMKGSPDAPKCKFSRKMVEILKEIKAPFGSYDILTNEAVRQGLKEYSNWPTYPQLYVGGKFIGGVDIVAEMKEAGELGALLPLPPQPAAAPSAAPAAGGPAAPSPLTHEATARLQSFINKAPVVLFMKGDPSAPACGFSQRMVSLLQEAHVPFAHHDILSDSATREGLKLLSSWPTYPQLYVKGQLVGGLDVVKQMVEENPEPLALQLGVQQKEPLAARIDRLLGAAHITLFMKGSPHAPACGFSAEAVRLLGTAGIDCGAAALTKLADGRPLFASFDVLTDDELRQGLKAFSNWPTYPQLYVEGKLLGGVDIMKELAEAGELVSALKVP